MEKSTVLRHWWPQSEYCASLQKKELAQSGVTTIFIIELPGIAREFNKHTANMQIWKGPERMEKCGVTELFLQVKAVVRFVCLDILCSCHSYSSIA